MNSDTSTRYGSRVRRHGRSRAARRYQASSLRVKACAVRGFRARGVDETAMARSEEHTSELQSHSDLVCRLLLEKKKKNKTKCGRKTTKSTASKTYAKY